MPQLVFFFATAINELKVKERKSCHMMRLIIVTLCAMDQNNIATSGFQSTSQKSTQVHYVFVFFVHSFTYIVQDFFFLPIVQAINV